MKSLYHEQTVSLNLPAHGVTDSLLEIRMQTAATVPSRDVC
jgi:hypothetical protein